MSASSVVVVDTGVANTASVLRALERAGARPFVSSDPRRVERADRVVLPGVGSFGRAAERLERLGLADVLRERLHADRPLLAVCLGLQLLGTASLESPRGRGLGVLDLVARPLPARDGLPVPQQGWNRVAADPGCRVLASGWAAFANSYAFFERPSGWSAAWAEYGERFVAGLERGAVVACQFHPELSSAYGAALLGRFLAVRPRAVAAGGGR